jgi:hypothetical protein
MLVIESVRGLPGDSPPPAVSFRTAPLLPVPGRPPNADPSDQDDTFGVNCFIARRGRGCHGRGEKRWLGGKGLRIANESVPNRADLLRERQQSNGSG